MKTRKILLVSVTVILVIIVGFYAYLNALGSMWVLNKPDTSPFYVTKKPIIVKKILLPKGTKITYEKQYFWEKYEQKEPLNSENITDIYFKEGTTINWGGVPIIGIVKFFNPKMKGFTVYADFKKQKNKTKFSKLWKNCNDDLGITIKDTDDWSFNKKNILDIESCGVNYQRYFKKDNKQQRYLDSLYNELITVKD